MFKDDENNNNCVVIETIGERTYNKIYFKVKDVSIGFQIPNLHKTLLNKSNGYEDKIHFKRFRYTEYINNVFNETKQIIYLTYEGILRVLFCSRNNKTSKFIRWATETLFTVQMGTDESKEDLVETIGLNISDMRRSLDSSVSYITCIYLLEIGYIKDFRETFGITEDLDDNYLICKYGYTNNLSRRLHEHNTAFKKLNKNIRISVITYAMIEEEFLSQAENELKNSFELTENNLLIDNHNELIYISKNKIKNIKKCYKKTQEHYVGKHAVTASHYDALVKDIGHQYIVKQIILEKDNERLTEILNSKNEILNSKNEIIDVLKNK
jgi:hypothetical protein